MNENKGCCQSNLPNARLSRVALALVGVSFPLFSVGLGATEFEWKPSLSASYIHILDAELQGFSLTQPIEEGHQAYTLSPTLALSAKGPVWNANWSLSRTQIHQVEDGFDDDDYNNITLNNEFSFMKKRLTLFANATRLNRNINNEFEGVTDPIFGQDEYLEVDTLTTGIRFKTSPAVDWRTNASVQLSQSDYDESAVDTTNFTSTNILSGDRHSASLEVGYGRSPQQVRAQFSFSGNFNETERRGKQNLLSLDANIGVPVWQSLDIVFTAFKSINKLESTQIDERQLDNENLGVGVAWRLGPRSFVEITRNKETKNSAFLTDNEGSDDDFTSFRLVVETNEKAQFSYVHSRRFYGDSNQFSLTKKSKRWSLSGSYSETLDTRTRLEPDFIDAGIFACPVIDSPRQDCVKLIAPPTSPSDELFYFEFTDVDYLFVDELALIKSMQLSYDYRFKKTTVKLAYNQSSFDYLERGDDAIDSERDTTTYSFNLDHRLNRRTTLKLNAAFSEVKNSDDSIQRKGEQRSIALERRLTRKATGTLSYKYFDNEDGQNQRGRTDNRIELTYKYEF